LRCRAIISPSKYCPVSSRSPCFSTP
jgi:hypothetical protein